jgi:hypothetical protein
MRVQSVWSIVAAGVFASLTSLGCAVRGEAEYAEPVGQVEITSAPVVDFEAYPHTVYQGRTVYYVNGRWGYPHGVRGWATMRNEPPELVRYRQHVDVAPPAPRYEYRQEAPPPAVQVH